MNIEKRLWPLLIVNIIAIIIFTMIFMSRQNYEFLMYIGVIIFFLLVILFTNNRMHYPMMVLWGLSLWSFLHMAGGGLKYHGEIFYKLMLIPIVGEPYNIFKYDQFVHIIGFGVATLTMYFVLKPLLKPNIKKYVALSIIIIMAGLGVGALNEIIEFGATVLVPETNVGGYENTSLDLVADLIGGIIAMIYIRIKEFKS